MPPQRLKASIHEVLLQEIKDMRRRLEQAVRFNLNSELGDAARKLSG